MPFEDDLGAALRQTGDTFSTDNRALAAAGLAQGRSVHRRRTVAVVGTVAAVAAAVVTAGLVVPGGTAREVRPANPSTPDATSRIDDDKRNGNDGSKDSSKGDSDGNDSGATLDDSPHSELFTVLRQLLPEGTIFSGLASDTESVPNTGASVVQAVWDDGHGASTISVNLSRVQAGQRQDECPDLALMKPGTTCKRTELPGEAVLVVIKGWEYQDNRKGPKDWRAILTTPDGRQIQADEWNAPAQKGRPTTRENPPLSAAQLGDLVLSARWDRFFSDIPEAPDQPTQPGAGPGLPSSAKIMALLKDVLPKGLEVTVPPGQRGRYVHLTVDDGNGATFVEVDFQQWAPDEVDDPIFAQATVLPDGTKLVKRSGAGDKGGAGIVRWTADTIRPDGLRVAVTAFNSDGYHRPVTREVPGVSMDELVKAATDPRWAELK
ncbi:hypothetical protein ACIF70_18965 [Actinacidiphila glaucinigra]|uniref:hypothetical protein n=1 Tax=Actinacidiphila glaucinigra TaxID=235986 RepID=UPI002DD89530|nr:hypothetical protein [Actinacidiphila glaucinigra]WSD59066.1 hypothetical protein OIE69_09175 [Actinacidiphila glaucinigra]